MHYNIDEGVFTTPEKKIADRLANYLGGKVKQVKIENKPRWIVVKKTGGLVRHNGPDRYFIQIVQPMVNFSVALAIAQSFDGNSGTWNVETFRIRAPADIDADSLRELAEDELYTEIQPAHIVHTWLYYHEVETGEQ